jgi:hypothetical protein
MLHALPFPSLVVHAIPIHKKEISRMKPDLDSVLNAILQLEGSYADSPYDGLLTDLMKKG